jgi:hypothetical protein
MSTLTDGAILGSRPATTKAPADDTGGTTPARPARQDEGLSASRTTAARVRQLAAEAGRVFSEMQRLADDLSRDEFGKPTP